ncbi:YciI family protein [Kribbella sp. NPDC006257]|uniref:YciI family protein n=1 Tax=Kribbella sp. NPDC006257 TaxID=3156738 RepID=UPI0033B03928
MEYFVYGRDRVGADGLKESLGEEHWAFMDRYDDRLIARGPTLTGQDDDARSTGSLHIVELPDVEAVQEFAYEEPYYRAGVFETVDIYAFVNTSARTMWQFTDAIATYDRYLLLALGDIPTPPKSTHLIVYGELLSLDGQTPLGQAALVEAPDPQSAATLLPGTTETHPWTFGGRR